MKNFKKLLGSIMCYFGFHDYIITKYSIYKDKKCNHLQEEGFNRTCERCNKQQKLERPEEYHPTKFVWVDLNNKT